jgi:hypothetical protein
LHHGLTGGKDKKGRCVRANPSAFGTLLPTGNLIIRFSALSLVAESTGVFFNGFTHLRPENGLLNQGLFTKDLLHDESPPLNGCGDMPLPVFCNN